MDPTFAARFPFEMFHDVRHVRVVTIDAGLGQGLVEKPARGPDKRTTGDVLFISRLFADKKDLGGANLSFAKDGLRSVLIQIAAHAARGRCF